MSKGKVLLITTDQALPPELAKFLAKYDFELASSPSRVSAPSVAMKNAVAIGKSVRPVFTVESCKQAPTGACRT
jgi:hypothetical protein